MHTCNDITVTLQFTCYTLRPEDGVCHTLFTQPSQLNPYSSCFDIFFSHCRQKCRHRLAQHRASCACMVSQLCWMQTRPAQYTSAWLSSVTMSEYVVCCASFRGLLPGEKPELKRVLEQRRLEQHREQELALRPPLELETELRKRQQILLEYEQEEIRRREEQEKGVPEFVRVKDNLRRTQVSGQ
uniref:Uncharacterized protein n=1 Tax=Oncorhynchus tshawytscha TaxID=74940 RepID=A0AAZ3PGS9_ONCTS